MNDQEIHSVSATELSGTEALGRDLLALNNDHARELSWLEPRRLEYLVGEAFLARRIGHVDAFLLAFDQDARYDNVNFEWFRADAAGTSSGLRDRGSARRLYRELFERAIRARHDRIVCEVNSTPPNPASDAFHAALGFVEVGAATLYDGSRTVRYLSCRLAQD